MHTRQIYRWLLLYSAWALYHTMWANISPVTTHKIYQLQAALTPKNTIQSAYAIKRKKIINTLLAVITGLITQQISACYGLTKPQSNKKNIIKKKYFLQQLNACIHDIQQLNDQCSQTIHNLYAAHNIQPPRKQPHHSIKTDQCYAALNKQWSKNTAYNYTYADCIIFVVATIGTYIYLNNKQPQEEVFKPTLITFFNDWEIHAINMPHELIHDFVLLKILIDDYNFTNILTEESATNIIALLDQKMLNLLHNTY